MLNKERSEATRGGLALMPMDRSEAPGQQPAWVAAELPPEYGEIASKIAILEQEACRYEKLARVLWCTGRPLTLAVRDVFAALEFKTDLPDEGASYDLAVELEPQRRLLVEVLAGVSPLDRKSPALARALRATQEEAGPGDRVVLVANIAWDKPVAMRQDVPAEPDALRIVNGLGANLVTTATLFGFWRYSLRDLAGARNSVNLLHGLDGGIFS